MLASHSMNYTAHSTVESPLKLTPQRAPNPFRSTPYTNAKKKRTVCPSVPLCTSPSPRLTLYLPPPLYLPRPAQSPHKRLLSGGRAPLFILNRAGATRLLYSPCLLPSFSPALIQRTPSSLGCFFGCRHPNCKHLYTQLERWQEGRREVTRDSWWYDGGGLATDFGQLSPCAP